MATARNKLNCEPIQYRSRRLIVSVRHTDVSVNYFLHGGYARTDGRRVFVDLDAIFRSPRNPRVRKRRKKEKKRRNFDEADAR